jgi:drug/metabolite transporter (DMT)-like permease
MKRFYLIGFMALLAFDTLAQLSFKYAAIKAGSQDFSMDWLLTIFTMPWIYGAFVGYIGSFFCWMTLLKYAPIGPAFAISHLEIVSVMLFSMWLFNEHVGWPQALAALLILAGIGCLAMDEGDSEQLPEANSPGRA